MPRGRRGDGATRRREGIPPCCLPLLILPWHATWQARRRCDAPSRRHPPLLPSPPHPPLACHVAGAETVRRAVEEASPLAAFPSSSSLGMPRGRRGDGATRRRGGIPP